MKRLVLLVLCVGVLLGGLAVQGVAGTINFDNVSAPELFVNAVALTELYASQGVHFSGPGGLDGGVILNQGSNFGINAHSEPNFLAFSRSATVRLKDGGIPIDPETISFDALMATVSIYAAASHNSSDSGVFTMTAFDASDNPVDSDTITSWDWAQLSVSGSGIKYVVLQESGASAFIYDDLSYTPVPLPGAVFLLGSGLLGMMGWRQLKRA